MQLLFKQKMLTRKTSKHFYSAESMNLCYLFLSNKLYSDLNFIFDQIIAQI